MSKNITNFLWIWASVLVANQLLLFHACFSPYCISAALPHTFILSLFSFFVIRKLIKKVNVIFITISKMKATKNYTFILFLSIYPFVCYGWSFTNPFDTTPTIEKCFKGIEGQVGNESLIDPYSNNKDLVIESCKLAAEKGEVRAQLFLGNFYSLYPPDSRKSFDWYKKAADQGSYIGDHNVGLAYKFGRGVIKNNDEAIKWLMKSAVGDSQPMSFFHIGDIYESADNIIDSYIAYSVALAIGTASWQNANMQDKIRSF